MRNADKYIGVIQYKVARDMQTEVPGGGIIFHQNLASCHAAKNAKKMLQEIQTKVFE